MDYKKIVLLLPLCIITIAPQAQTLGEWFNQKKTQTKYLIQQIAELKVYAGLLNKGYAIAKGGLATINDIKHGQFNLHADYFGSLKEVSPAIRNTVLVTDILKYQQQLIKLCDANRTLITTKNLGSNTMGAKNSFDGILAEVAASVELLTLLLTNGKLAMKDDQRLLQLQGLDDDLSSLYKYAQNYQLSTAQLIRQRKAAQGSLYFMERVTGIK